MIGPLIPIIKNSKKPYLGEWTTLSESQLSEAMGKNNGGNVGLRLDRYVTLDPDALCYESLVNSWEKTGKLPPTVAWKTARGYTKRLYLRPDPWPFDSGQIIVKQATGKKDEKGRDIFDEMELRSGSGHQDVIPPSEIDGVAYRWLKDQDPEAIEPAPLPEFVIKFFQENQARGESTRPKGERQEAGTATLTFNEPGRDVSLYTIALALRKSGMPRPDVEMVVCQLAASCNPPFSEKTALAKVQSAFNQTPRERGLSSDIREWIEGIEGQFAISDLDRELNIKQSETDNRRKIVQRLAEAGIIARIPNRPGIYTKVDSACDDLDPFSTEKQSEYKLIWPFRLHELCYLYPKSIAIVAGAKDAGKTAFLLNLALANSQHGVFFFNSEMSAAELRDRLDKFEYPPEAWQHVNWKGNFAPEAVENIVVPDALNIIDYLEEPEEIYRLGNQIGRIWRKLTTGVAIIGLQKNPGADVARGGYATMQKARIYLNLDGGTAELKSGKLWRIPGKNPKGMKWQYKLVQGCNFVT
ncbi:MAG: bifunctional DNA primase/polymerase [Desulfobacca sp.]|nr:bifunctional DNA primase/polymerase [Desulfobacca sp.]